MTRFPPVLSLMFWLSIATQVGAQTDDAFKPRVSTIAPGPEVQYELQSRLIQAVPGDVIELLPGRYQLHRQLDIATSHLTIRGAGSNKTVLSFGDQQTGGSGIESTGDHFLLEGLAVEDTAGNAVKVLGADGVTVRDVRVEWTGPAEPTNGAYGLYPVQCQNVLIENCMSIGASDAGLYVGQCRNVIVRNNHAERNVAGIEIENTVGADVYGNTATNNTGGILVFDLPGLQVKAGKNVRVFQNKVRGNNHANFATKGTAVAGVPPGTGVMVMATSDVEVFENEIDNHRTGGIAILSYMVRGKKLKDKSFDPFSESVSVHNNRITNSGFKPAGEFGLLLQPVLGTNLPDIVWDGVVNPEKMVDGRPTPSQIPSITDNAAATFVNFDLARLNPKDILLGNHRLQRDLAVHAIARAPLKPIELAESKPPSQDAGAAVMVYRSAKKRLSEYGLFIGPLAQQQPAPDVHPYLLNTPLFSDYTTKYRFIRVPAGTKMEFRDGDVMQFPVGTVIAKTFSYPHDMTDPSQGERLLETRIELLREDGWYGFSYRWNDEQSDATLVLGGGELNVSWVHSDGEKRSNHYEIPNANQCLNCHRSGDDYVPIGPVAENLHRLADFGQGSENQLARFVRLGLLAHAPEPTAIDAWPGFDQPSDGSIEERARTWLHVNCAHCHNPVGTARTSGLDLRLSQSDPLKLGVWKTPVAAGHGSGGHSYDIVPGKPDESILVYRIESKDPSVTMPSVSKRLVPVEAAALIREWIKHMKE